MKIWFDMDGTIADLYGVKNWSKDLRAEKVEPYKNALPLVNMQALARVLNRLNREGHEINIISWASKNASAEYIERIAKAKREWIAEHLASVKFTNIEITAYGEPKGYGRNGILFDDEIKNRAEWENHEGNIAHDVNEIIEILKAVK